jgi:hypothetical protein
VFEDVEAGLFRVIYEYKHQSGDIPKGRPKLLLEFIESVSPIQAASCRVSEVEVVSGAWNRK